MSGQLDTVTDPHRQELATEVSAQITAAIRAAEQAAQSLVAEAEESARRRRREAEEEAARILGEARKEQAELVRRQRASGEEFVRAARSVLLQVAEAQHRLEQLVEALSLSIPRALDDDGEGIEAAVVARSAEEDRGLPVGGLANGSKQDGHHRGRRPRWTFDGHLGLPRAGPSASFPDGGPAITPERTPPLTEPPRAPEADAYDAEQHARLLALQMAAEGKSRGEVARHLQTHFDLPRIEAALDLAFEAAQPTG